VASVIQKLWKDKRRIRTLITEGMMEGRKYKVYDVFLKNATTNVTEFKQSSFEDKAGGYLAVT
jgi:hypothetical protein